MLKDIVILIAVVFASSDAAMAAGKAPAPALSLDKCDLQAKGLAVATDQGCLQVSGGFSSYWHWGNTNGRVFENGAVVLPHAGEGRDPRN